LKKEKGIVTLRQKDYIPRTIFL